MSSLTDIEKRHLDRVLGMACGYVLDFTDTTFGEFFERHGIDIHGTRYRTFGTSKAKKLRAFWASEPDRLVGTVLSELLDSHETIRGPVDGEPDKGLPERSRGIAGRLTGRFRAPGSDTAEGEFLAREFKMPNIQKMPIDAQVVPIVEARLDEAYIAFRAGAHLSVIFLCGSVLEAVPPGAAREAPVRFNQTSAAPKGNNGSPKRFDKWSLAQLIDAACEIGVLKLDIKKFSHGLRDFRNYIHPYEQLVSGLTPDEHTARVCFQVLKAALASLAGERR